MWMFLIVCPYVMCVCLSLRFNSQKESAIYTQAKYDLLFVWSFSLDCSFPLYILFMYLSHGHGYQNPHFVWSWSLHYIKMQRNKFLPESHCSGLFLSFHIYFSIQNYINTNFLNERYAICIIYIYLIIKGDQANASLMKH